MFNIGEMVKIKHNNKIGVILSREEISGKYVVFTQDEITPTSLFAEQIEKVTFESKIRDEQITIKMYSDNNKILKRYTYGKFIEQSEHRLIVLVKFLKNRFYSVSISSRSQNY